MDLFLVCVGIAMFVFFISFWIEEGWTHPAPPILLIVMILCAIGVYCLNAGENNRISVTINKYDKVVNFSGMEVEVDSPTYLAVVKTGKPLSAFSEKTTNILDPDYSNLKKKIDNILQKYPSAKVEVENNTQMEKD
jgi:hypothetical protein